MELLRIIDKNTGRPYFHIIDLSIVCDTCLKNPNIRKEYFCPHRLENVSTFRSVHGCRILKVPYICNPRVCTHTHASIICERKDSISAISAMSQQRRLTYVGYHARFLLCARNRRHPTAPRPNSLSSKTHNPIHTNTMPSDATMSAAGCSQPDRNRHRPMLRGIRRQGCVHGHVHDGEQRPHGTCTPAPPTPFGHTSAS